MKKALGLAGKYVIMFLSCLFPRSRKIYIFGAWLGEQFADNPKYLFLEAQEHKEIRPIWITKNESVCRKVRELGYEAYMFDSFKGILMQLRAKYVVVCNGISDVNHTFMGRAVFLNLWHGVPLKKVGYDDDKVKNWDSKGQKIRRMIQEIPLGKEYVVATSDFYAPIYESAFRRSKSHIITLGQPRNDIFYDQSGKFHASHQLSKAAETDEAILEELAEPQRLSKFAVNDENEMEYRMLCTIIEKRGSAPRSIGTQMLVTSDNRIIGTIGGGCAEAEVITRCRGYFAEMRKGIHGICEIVKIQMSTDNVEEEGMVCGGRIEVLLEET